MTGDTTEPATVTVRAMAPADVPAVAAIERAASPDPWSAELFADEFTSGTPRRWLVAVAAGKIVGFGGTMRVTDELHVMNMAVTPDCRRRGVARRLLASLLRMGGDGGAVAATLEVRAGNDAAVELYRRFGFEIVGRRERYYPDGAAAAIMWVHRIDRSDYRGFLLAEEEAAA